MTHWKQTLDEVLEDRREAMGERPAFSELIDFREGRLAEERREELRERATVDPDFARELLDVMSFSDDLDDGDGLSEARRDAAWRTFALRAGIEAAAATAEGPTLLPMPRSRPFLMRSQWPRLAAVFLVGLLLGAQIWRDAGDDPAGEALLGNVETVSLAGRGSPGSRGAGLKLSPGAGWILFEVSTATLPESSRYEVSITEASGQTVHRQGGLTPLAGGLLTLFVPASELPDGAYVLEVRTDPTASPIETLALTVSRQER